MRRSTAALLAGVLIAVTACSTTDPYVRTRGAEELSPTASDDANGNNPFDTTPDAADDTASDDTSSDDTSSQDTGSTIPDAEGPVFTLPDDKPATEYDDELEVMVNDIQNYWRNEYPAVYGQPYTELLNGVHALRPGDSVSPGCGEPRTDYSAVQGNAFYCVGTDFIAYDDVELMPMLVQQLGIISIGVVMAHEWGHAIQSRAGYEDETVYMEQQADCFAGAWVAHIARGENDQISFTDEELKGALNAMIFVRDPAGTTSATDPGAHGSAFDRVGAFEDGFRNSASQCATYADTRPTVIQFPYGDIPQENAPLTDPTGEGLDIISIATNGLNTYWTSVVSGMPELTVSLYDAEPSDACDAVPDSIFKVSFYCESSGSVVAEADTLTELYNAQEYGDMGVAYLIATAWAEAVMQTTGANVEGEDRALAADCLVGAFSRSALPVEFNPNRPEQGIELSPGDLDEAVSTAIAAADDTEDTDRRGSPFEKIEAFRLGVLSDYPACQDRFGI